MKRINAYETTDGLIYSNRKEAKAHQQRIDVLEALRHVAENAPRTESIDKDHLGDFLCDNAVAIEAAMRGIKISFALPEPQVEAAPAKDDMNNLLGEQAPEPLDFVLSGFKFGTVGALVSPGATGKTMLADAGNASPVNRDAEPVALAT